MRLTQYTEYSFRVLIYLTEHTDCRVTIRDISDSYDISYFHLTKVVHNLASKGYVDGHRGRNGGVSLALKPENIRLDQVVRDTETLVFPGRKGKVGGESYSVLGGHFQMAVSLFMEYLSRFTLADLSATALNAGVKVDALSASWDLLLPENPAYKSV